MKKIKKLKILGWRHCNRGKNYKSSTDRKEKNKAGGGFYVNYYYSVVFRDKYRCFSATDVTFDLTRESAK